MARTATGASARQRTIGGKQARPADRSPPCRRNGHSARIGTHSQWSSTVCEALLTIVIQDPGSGLDRTPHSRQPPVEAPSIIYEVSACLDGPRERSVDWQRLMGPFIIETRPIHSVADRYPGHILGRHAMRNVFVRWSEDSSRVLVTAPTSRPRSIGQFTYDDRRPTRQDS